MNYILIRYCKNRLILTPVHFVLVKAKFFFYQDVDETEGPSITREAIVRIRGDGFVMPTEPIFSQPYYLASYTTSHEIVLEQVISLQQGYHENVEFILEGGKQD